MNFEEIIEMYNNRLSSNNLDDYVYSLDLKILNFIDTKYPELSEFLEHADIDFTYDILDYMKDIDEYSFIKRVIDVADVDILFLINESREDIVKRYINKHI